MSESAAIVVSPEDKENEKPPQTTADQVQEQNNEQQQQQENNDNNDDLVSAFNRGLEAIKRSDFESAVAQLGKVAANGDKVSAEVLNKARTRLVYALLQTGRDEEADKVMESPTDTNGGGPPQAPINSNATEEAEEAPTVNGNSSGDNSNIKNSRFELRPVTNSEDAPAKVNNDATKKKLRKERRSEERKKDRWERRERRNKNRASQSEDGGINCSYCSITLSNQQEFFQHCRGEKHQQAIFSDHGREWKHRPPPRGIGSESYSLCGQFARESRCRFEGQCVEAHSEDELKEWRERFEYRKSKAQEASRLCGRTFVEIVLDKLAAVEYRHDRIFQQNIVGIACSNSGLLDLQASKKGASSGLSWVFEVRAGSHLLQDVGLMNDSNRRHFSLDYVKHVEEGGGVKSIRTFNAGGSDKSANNVQEWSHPSLPR